MEGEENKGEKTHWYIKFHVSLGVRMRNNQCLFFCVRVNTPNGLFNSLQRSIEYNCRPHWTSIMKTTKTEEIAEGENNNKHNKEKGEEKKEKRERETTTKKSLDIINFLSLLFLHL